MALFPFTNAPSQAERKRRRAQVATGLVHELRAGLIQLRFSAPGMPEGQRWALHLTERGLPHWRRLDALLNVYPRRRP